MLTPRDNLRQAIAFGGPEVTPLVLPDGPGTAGFGDALVLPPAAGLGPDAPAPGAATWTDDWGTTWQATPEDPDPVGFPLAAGYDDTLRVPDPRLPARYAAADAALAGRGDRYALAVLPGCLFERLWWLRGFADLLIAPFDEPAAWARCRDRVLEVHLAVLGEWLRRGVDGVLFRDDWGCGTGMLVHPDDWRRSYRGAYAALFAKVRRGGAQVWLDVPGDYRAVLPDLLDAGAQVLALRDRDDMPLADLARRFRGEACFWGGLKPAALARAQPDAVHGAVTALRAALGTPAGGFVAGAVALPPDGPTPANLAALRAAAGR